MDFDRVVQVRVRGPGGGGRLSTGYLIAPRLALTAGHVFRGLSTEGDLTQVCRPDAGNQVFPGLVRWLRADDEVDAALVEISGPDWVPPASWQRRDAGQRFGELVTTAAGQRVTARGFPRFQRSADGRWDEQVDGRVSPGTGLLAGRYEVVSDDPLPLPMSGDDASQWAGMSGAAVFHGDLLLGVVRADRRAVHGARLTATRVRDVLADPGAAAVVAAHSDRTSVIEPAELAGALGPVVVSRDLRSPAMLLRAEAEAVSFRGRETEMRALLEWLSRDAEDPPVLVLTGPGGQGKSRLARWLVDAARAHGHIAGQIAPGTDWHDAGDLPGLPAFALVRTSTLVVVDYAESRPALVRRLIELSQASGGKVKLVLLARASGAWKTDPIGAGAAVHEILASAPEMKLGPLDDTAAERHRAFEEAVRDLARLLGLVRGYQDVDWPTLAQGVPLPGGLGTRSYQTALSVQMAALAGLLQAGPGRVAVAAGEPVEMILLRHEQRYWHRTASAQHLGELPSVLLRQAVAACCLCGAATQQHAETMLARLGYLPPDKVLAAALWLQQLYPSPAGRFLGSLQPDRVAEAHASTLVAESPGLLTRLLAGAADEQQVQAITVLARAALGDASADRRAEGEATVSRLAETLQEVHAPRDVLETANAALPRYSPVLAGLAARLADDLTAQYRQLSEASPGTHDMALAAALQNLSLRHTDAGQPAQALRAIEESVAIRRRHAEADSSLWGKLHIALLHQARCYEQLGLPEKARAAEREGAYGPDVWPHPSVNDDSKRLLSALPAPIDLAVHGLGTTVPVPGTANGERNLILYSPQVPVGTVRGLALATSHDDQATIEITLTEGDEEDTQYVKALATARAELPPGLPAGYPVDIEISYSRTGIISVQAFDGYSGTVLPRPIVERPHPLKPAEGGAALEQYRSLSPAQPSPDPGAHPAPAGGEALRVDEALSSALPGLDRYDSVAAARLQPSDIGTVLMTGGSSRIPAFQEMLRRVFGKPPVLSRAPDEDVARGAALLGAGKAKTAEPDSNWEKTSALPRGAGYEQMLEFFGIPPHPIDALDRNIARKRRRWNHLSMSGNPEARQKAAQVLALIQLISTALKRGIADDQGTRP